MGVDLSTTSPSFKCSILADNNFSTPGLVTSLSYGSDWTFDSSTQITVCSSLNGAMGIGCIVQNLKVLYNIPSLHGLMPFTNIGLHTYKVIFTHLMFLVKLIADYKLDERTGNSLVNSQPSAGSLTNASLCKLYHEFPLL